MEIRAGGALRGSRFLNTCEQSEAQTDFLAGSSDYRSSYTWA